MKCYSTSNTCNLGRLTERRKFDSFDSDLKSSRNRNNSAKRMGGAGQARQSNDIGGAAAATAARGSATQGAHAVSA